MSLKRLLITVGGLLAVVGGLLAYDAVGYRNAQAFEAEHADQPALVLERWQAFAGRHPTRHLLGVTSAAEETQRFNELNHRIRLEEREARLAELRQQADDPDADPEGLWRTFNLLRDNFPELTTAEELVPLREALKTRRDRQVAERSARTFAELAQAAQRTDSLPALVAQADRFLQDFPGSAEESEARRLRQAILHRLDEQDIDIARRYSEQHPFNFQTRREHYQRYLDHHPGGGAFTDEAEQAIRDITLAWDRHDFRAIRDHFLNRPGEVDELVLLARRYLAVHPQGQFCRAAEELLRFTERITVRGDYRVTLRRGSFDRSVARFFSKGPKLSVELEVAGIRHGPSTIVYNEYEPVWDFEFPRSVQWKMGDPVVVRVKEHSWNDRALFEFRGDDPLALRLLNCQLVSGDSWIQLETNFSMPELPTIE